MEFVKIPFHRHDDVIKHLRDTFFADEPLNKAVNLCQPGQGHLELEKHSLLTLQDGLSVMAVTDKNEIAGVVLNGYLGPDDTKKSKENLALSNDTGFRKIFNLLYDENLQTNLFLDFNADKIFDIRILSVDSKYRGQGIAKKMILKSEEIAKESNFKIMKTDATGLFSQKLSESLGFNTVREIYYKNYKDDNGYAIFDVDPPHEKFKIMYKLLY